MKGFFSIILLMFILSCTSRPLLEPSRVSFQSDLSKEQIVNAIEKGARLKGWKVTSLSDGVVNLRVRVRQHRLSVRLEYDSRSYKIRYKDSYRLNYNGSDNTIHRSANRWIKNLEQSITRSIEQSLEG